MRTILLNCLHSVQCKDDDPAFHWSNRHRKVWVYCKRCGDRRQVISREDTWKVKCLHCRYGRYATNEETAMWLSSTHMTNRGHRVMRWRMDRPRQITYSEPESPQLSLLDEPPF